MLSLQRLTWQSATRRQLIKIGNGRMTSERTPEEIARLIREEFQHLSSDERKAVQLCLQEMQDPAFNQQEDPPIRIIDVLEEGEYIRKPVDIETFVKDPYYLGKTSDMLYPKLMGDMVELFSGGYGECIMTGSIGFGKCLGLNSFFTEGASGRRVSIGEMIGEEPLVPSLSEGEIKHQKASRVWKSGRKKCLRMTLNSGQWLEVSTDHPVLTPSGYVPISDLKIGDFVAAARTIPAPESLAVISDECVKAAACLIADGSMTATNCMYIKGDKRLFDDFKKAVKKAPGFLRFGQEEFKRGAWYVNCCGVLPWARTLGIDCKSKDKRVPAGYFGLSNRQLALFINRLFTDGSVYVGKHRKIELGLASEGLIDDIQHLLRRFGIVARKYYHEASIKQEDGTKNVYDSWRLDISDAPMQLRFLEFIGPIFGKETECHELLKDASSVRSNPNWDVVPITTEEIREIRKETGPHDSKEWARKAGLCKGSYMGRDKFRRLCKGLGYSGKYRKFADMDVVWEKIESIEDAGVQDVYDLTVPETHNAVVNGIIVHNTFFASIAACRVLYELSCLRDPHRSYGIAPGSDISFIVLSVKEDLAIKVAFTNIAAKIKDSDYFKEHFPFKAVKRELLFPRGVMVAARASTDSAALGLNVFGGFIDEGNFMPDMKQKESIDKRMGNVNRAKFLYDQLQRRMKSRFMKHGKLPGLMIVVSSKQTKDDFTAQRIKEAKDDPGVFVRDYCLTGDTKVPLLDGRILTMKELVAKYGGADDSFWLYSVDARKRTVVPGRAHSPRLTARREAVLNIGLDNGSVVRATASHPFMLRDGSYRRAGELSLGDSLMPLYRRLDKKGYEEIAQPGWDCRWQKTHHMAARFKYGRWPKRGDDGLPIIVHHMDHDKRNNIPENLVWWEWTQHQEHHSQNMDVLLEYVRSDKHRAFASEHMKKLHADPEFAEERNRRGAEALNILWNDPEFRKKQAAAASKTLSEWHASPESIELQRVNSLKRWDKSRKVTMGAVVDGAERGLLLRELAGEIGCCQSAICVALKRNGYPLYSELRKYPERAPNNHTVVSVEDGGVEDVYDLTVDGYSNFALDAGVFVHNSTWDVKEGAFSGERFPVLVGNDMVQSKILTQEEADVMRPALQDGLIIVDVPEEYRSDFTNDLDGSIRDVAGIATVSISPFLQQRDKIIECIDPNRDHPFSKESWVHGDGGSVSWPKIAHQVQMRDGAELFQSWQPLFYPGASRHVHIDPSLNTDSTGFAMGCVTGYKHVTRRDRETQEQYTESAPIIWVDFLLRISPPVGGEIDHGEVRSLVYKFQGHGFMVSLITMDQFNSSSSLQKFATKGITAERMSVDKPMDAYDTLKEAIYEGRVHFYGYEPLLEELRTIQKDHARNKVDHPKTGCFVGETRIPLLDGTHPQISELVGKEVWVYSSREDGSIVPGKARGRCTKNVDELVDVVLDSGAVERCTPEHLWRLRDGSYKEAKDLRPGIDRLMPINRQWPVNGGYEHVSGVTRKKHLTHRFVMEYFNGIVPDGSIVHHINGAKTDNRPENLEIVSKNYHAFEHTSNRHASDPGYREKVREGLQRFNESDEGRRKHSLALSRTMANLSKEDYLARARKKAAFRSDVTLASLEQFAFDPEAVNANAAARIIGCGRNVVVRVLRENGFSTWGDFLESDHGPNHKVRAVIPVKLSEPVPVFDLEVDEHSNFALCSGVFVHNSKDLADSLAGIVFTLTTRYHGPPMGILKGLSKSADSESDGQQDIVADDMMLPFLTG